MINDATGLYRVVVKGRMPKKNYVCPNVFFWADGEYPFDCHVFVERYRILMMI